MLVGTVIFDGGPRLAALEGDRVRIGESAGLGDLLGSGGTLEDERYVEVGLEEVDVDAPLRPPFLVCCGQNYSDHLLEQGATARSEPEFFLKAGQTIARPNQPFALRRRVTEKLDYETELGAVIGRVLCNATVEETAAAIFGYLVVNDLSARDRQIKADGRPALGRGKSFDGATRLSNWVVTADGILDPQALAVSTTVNGEYRQLNSTASMIFGCCEIISFYSRTLTLLPGTIVATGTPGGTALGQDAELGGRLVTPPGCVPASYLRAGDVVVSEIEDVGTLVFDVVDADD
jgi:2-keto-4-pentenoate hydratase/2-oxohepta-3-ene-1,7-dioic acid hydratase in catechol pathway